MKSPWLDYLAENIEEIGNSLSFVERQVQEVQRRARPLLDLTADIWERGYPLPGELDRLLLLASLVERADLQTRFVDWCDGLRGGAGAFSGQRLLWHTFNELVRDVFSSDPFRPLTPDQRERFLSEFRRMATPEEFEREVGRAKGYDAMRRVIAAHRAGNPGQMAAAAADLELAHDARGLLTAAWIIADSTKNAELVRRLVTTARNKVTVADVDALLIENAYTALKAIGAADEVRGWATEALSIASDPGQQARIKRVLDSIR